MLAKSAPDSWVRGSRGSQGNCICVPNTWNGGPAAAAWNTGAPPEQAAHAELESEVSATLCSSERSGPPASWSHILVLQDSSVYHHLLTPSSLYLFGYKVPAVTPATGSGPTRFMRSPSRCAERLQKISTHWEAKWFNPRVVRHGCQQSLQKSLHFFCWRRQ